MYILFLQHIIIVVVTIITNIIIVVSKIMYWHFFARKV